MHMLHMIRCGAKVNANATKRHISSYRVATCMYKHDKDLVLVYYEISCFQLLWISFL